MQAFTKISGPAAPLMRTNIDTDVIIRIERLAASSSKEELGRHAFEALRYRGDGSEEPEFVCNKPAFRGAPILLAGPNFGCGSSREGAVWALMGMGISCVIAPSFGDIFYNNCLQNGMLAIVLPEAEVFALAEEAAAGAPFTVDLERCVIEYPDGSASAFPIDAQRRNSLLAGLDEIGLALRDDHIRQWQERDRMARPWVWNLDHPQTARIALLARP
jgi:3-isopropylmalate/(R)-2-methylmalate dehydratase small subunit